MSNHTHVWHGTNVDVDVYLEDGQGNVTGGIVLSYCYWVNVNINATQEQTRRPVTGRARKKITNRQWEYSASVEHMYFSKEDEIRLDDIMSRNQPMRLELRCVDYSYPEDEYDIHTLKTAYASRYKVTARDNDIVTASADFEAEDFE